MVYSIEKIQNEVAEILRTVTELCDRNGILYYCQAGTVLGAIRHKGPIPWDHDSDIIIPSDKIDNFVECCLKYLPERYWIDYYKTNPNGFRRFPRVGLKGYSTDVLHLDVFKLIGIPDDSEGQKALLRECSENGEQALVKKKGRVSVLSSVKHMKIKQAINRAKICMDFSAKYLYEMEEICTRYPYAESSYVMNPFGKYGAKNIFKKEIYGDGKIVPYMDYYVRVPSETDFYLRQYYGEYMKYPSIKIIKKEMKKKFIVEKI